MTLLNILTQYSLGKTENNKKTLVHIRDFKLEESSCSKCAEIKLREKMKVKVNFTL
jgi:hypothetical protein